MADDLLPEPAGHRAPTAPTPGSVPPDRVLDGDGWSLYIDLDGWYLHEGSTPPRRITVDEAVRKVDHKNARAQIFRPTRMFIAHIARELADKAWISPAAEDRPAARPPGLDPKHTSEQIAQAGKDIARLGRELAEAEAAPLPHASSLQSRARGDRRPGTPQ